MRWVYVILGTGSIALDTTRTPFKTMKRVLGGAATYFSLSASHFCPVALIGVVGKDFPQAHWKLLESRHIDLQGVQRVKGKTMFFDSEFSYDYYARKTHATELNVYAHFDPVVPDSLRKTPFLYLGTLEPAKQLKMLENCRPRFALMDTIEFYIETQKPALRKVMAKVDGMVLNDIEARMLCKSPNLFECASTIQEWGPELVVIKKGENGSILFYKDFVFPLPAFPLSSVVDPTGAGDSFGGGFFGHLARSNKVEEKTLKEALAYGTIMGSFCVQDFSVNGLVSIASEDVEARFNHYREKLHI
ncbi:sugar kinase [Candidatus Micrarchaeota archaeon]|nr:sugar kinase [Candidatus Micrarchaeota archaeon]